ncbi:peptidoglycan-binding protein [Cellulomonas sp. 179-A 4D5 NHS]|uniref:peptidoglycan-binding domain-containing protein n=1 Tax=Cellulomonas sp. 179-A 4D5 NHS TaxID=3142378 RepID=UPI0039A12543
MSEASPGTRAQARSGRRSRPVWRRATSAAALVAAAALVTSACSAEEQTPVEQAQAEVTQREEALVEAQADAAAADEEFCTQAATYVTALDRYGDVLHDTAPTVGDVTTAGAELAQPQEQTADAAEAAGEARDAVATAQTDLATAQAELADAQAVAAGQDPPDAAVPTATATAAVPAATVARVEQAESDFEAARTGLTDETPLTQAAEQFNAAAVALEMSWLQVVAQSGCLSDEEQARAVAAARDYTLALQGALAAAGYLEGEVDGVYGPETVAAVEALQQAAGLPQTGTVDRATEAALESQLAAAGGAAAQQEVTATAALQQTLALAGYWDGPVDGQASDALTDALVALQTDLGVPPTGAVDAATVSAFEAALTALTAPTAEPAPEPTDAEPGSTPTPEAAAGGVRRPLA